MPIAAEKACAGVGIGDVARDHLDADGVGQLGGEVTQPVLATRDERHAVAAVRQFARDVGADTRRGAGDDGGGGRRRRWKWHRSNLLGHSRRPDCAVLYATPL